MTERINATLAESLITLMAHSDTHGQMIVSQLDVDLMEGDYRVFAERCAGYWKQFGHAPKAHVDDLVSDILGDPHDRRAATYRSIMVQMLRLLETINPTYVLGQLDTFIQAQRIKAAIILSADKLRAAQEQALPEIRDIWQQILRAPYGAGFNPGLRLSDYERVLGSLRQQQGEFTTGIELLDRRNVVPSRGTVMLFLGATGRGKTWALIHLGKRALMGHFKVLHVTLELSEDETAQRYYQSIFAVPKHMAEKIVTVRFKRGADENEYYGTETVELTPSWSLDSLDASQELRTRVTHTGALFDNLVIKKFPMRSLTVDALRGYLDGLDVMHHFIPDMLILDYIGVMKTDDKNHRISLGRTHEDFIGLCEERNVAGVTANQVGRVGAQARYVTMSHVSEDWSLTNSAHQVLTLSVTDGEFERNFARLRVDKARSEGDKFGVLLIQNYQTGQFVTDTRPLTPVYLKELAEKEAERKARAKDAARTTAKDDAEAEEAANSSGDAEAEEAADINDWR